jgi:ABC-2 type transport system permease protein
VTTALAVLNAERIKLVSLRSPLWSALLAALLSLGVAALQGATAYGAAGVRPESAATGVAVFGIPVLMILSAMTVTGEYRTGMIRTTFAATPNRALVLVAKAVVSAVCAGLYTAVLVLAAVVVAALLSDAVPATQLSVTAPGVWRVAGALAVYAMATAVLGVAAGALLRHTAGAVAILLLWPLVVEPILANTPDLGGRLGPFLPFVNAFVFTDVPWLFPVYAMPWGTVASLVYFLVVVGALFVAAVVVTNKRDA